MEGDVSAERYAALTHRPTNGTIGVGFDDAHRRRAVALGELATSQTVAYRAR